MANHVLTTHASFPGTAAFAQIAALRVKQVLRAISNRLAVRKLYDYDERMLKDIGLVHSDISAALDFPMTEDPSIHLRDVAAGRSRRRR